MTREERMTQLMDIMGEMPMSQYKVLMRAWDACLYDGYPMSAMGKKLMDKWGLSMADLEIWQTF